MLTGVRTIELRQAEWREFDFERRIWEIPVSRMKMRRPHLVPLSEQILAALREIQTVTGRYNLVFPGRNDITKPMSEASINQVLKRIGYHGKATGHGFRHTMSTILHEQGYDTAWIELQLAHVDKNTIRGTYNHAQYLEQRREMLQWYGDYLDELMMQDTAQASRKGHSSGCVARRHQTNRGKGVSSTFTAHLTILSENVPETPEQRCTGALRLCKHVRCVRGAWKENIWQ